MKIQYITTDLELESKEDLDQKLGDEVCPHLNKRIEDFYRVYLGMAKGKTIPPEHAPQ